VGDLTDVWVRRLIATCLGFPVEQVQQALHDRSRLSRALLGINRARVTLSSCRLHRNERMRRAIFRTVFFAVQLACHVAGDDASRV
jgi:hypothetical protein